MLAPSILLVSAAAIGWAIFSVDLLGRALGLRVRHLALLVLSPAIVTSIAYPGLGDPIGMALTLTGLAAVAVAWIHVEIDKEGDSGYERTTTIEGRKAYEPYEKATKTGKLDVVAAGRFLVAAESTGLDMKAFRAAIAKIDLAKLDSLKTQGAPAPTAGK